MTCESIASTRSASRLRPFTCISVGKGFHHVRQGQELRWFVAMAMALVAGSPLLSLGHLTWVGAGHSFFFLTSQRPPSQGVSVDGSLNAHNLSATLDTTNNNITDHRRLSAIDDLSDQKIPAPLQRLVLQSRWHCKQHVKAFTWS